MIALLSVMTVFMIACIICLVRAVLGPTAPDRVVALDALTALLTGCLVFLGVYYQASIFLDIALVYAIMSFLGTLAVAKYLEGRGLEE